MQYEGTRATPRLELGEAIQEFIDGAGDFIGIQALPIFETAKKAAATAMITRESLTRVPDTKRAADGGYNRDGIKAKDMSFSCVENGLEGALDDGKKNLYKSDFDAELAVTKGTARKVLAGQEARVAAALFNASVFTGAALYKDNSGAPWDAAASDIIAQVREAKEKVRKNCGIVPNAMILNQENINRAKSNTAIKDAIKYTARVTDAELENALADLFGVKKIFIAKGIYNSAKEGKTFSSADIWSDDYVMLAVVADDPGKNDLLVPSLGRTFLWTEDSPENATVESYRDEGIRSDVFRVRQHTDEKIIDPYFGFLIKVDA